VITNEESIEEIRKLKQRLNEKEKRIIEQENMIETERRKLE